MLYKKLQWTYFVNSETFIVNSQLIEQLKTFIMKIDKKQLIEQLRFLAEHDQNQLKEILHAVLKDSKKTFEESEAIYEAGNDDILELNRLAEESFERFDKVYKALS